MIPQSTIAAFTAFFIVWTGVSFGGGESKAYSQFRRAQKTKVCRKRLDTLKEFHELFGLPEFRQLLSKGSSKNLTTALENWSTDLIIKVVLQVEQDFQVLCPEDRRLKKIALELKKAYLNQLGFNVVELSAQQTTNLFRGLLVLKDEVPSLRMGLASLISQRPPADKILEKLFGKPKEVRDVMVLGATTAQTKELKKIVGGICKGFSRCPFWDPNLIYKVVIQQKKGLALYIPEVAVLILSEELLKKPNRLHRLVVAHELAHVAAQGAWVYQRRNWVEEFVAFSGWRRDKKGKWSVVARQPAGKREDELTKLSEASSFSILPDVVYLGEKKGKKPLDGFVFSKSYEESVRNNDPSEDLADHIAAYFFAAERFCLKGRNIAPSKYRWIAKNVFQHRPKVLNCKGLELKKQKKKKS